MSAVNRHGQGMRQFANNGLNVVPPVVVPGLPRNVKVAVDFGSNDALTVAYLPPLSDGGAKVTSYRVELDPATTTDYRDPTTTFQSPIAQTFDCPALPTHAVWAVETSPVGNASVEGGWFALSLARGGADLVSDPIPWDAPPLAADEVPWSTRTESRVYCEVTTLKAPKS